MFKRMTSIVLALALVLTCAITGLVLPASAASTDLIGDGDFEGALSKSWTWSTSTATNIQKYAIISEGNSPMTVIEESDGNHCLQIPEPSDTSKTYDRYFFALPVAASKTYRLTLRYKGSGLRLYFHSSYCASGAGVPTIAASDEWTTYTREFTTAASINKNFIIAIGHKASTGTVLVDDIQLTEVVDLTGVSLPEQIALAKGATQKLSLTTEPAGAVVSDIVWKSSNEAVATVASDGTVTAVDSGVAYITATVDGFTATTTVVVGGGDDKWTDTNLLVDGDFEAETLATNWSNFAGAAEFTFVDDPTGADNTCMKITGARRMNYKSLSAAKKDTTYKLTFRGMGNNKRFVFDFTYAIADEQIVIGADNYTVTGTKVYIYPESETEWNEYSIVFTTKASINTNYIFYAGGLDSAGLLYMDDISLTELGKATVSETLSGGSVSLASGSASGAALTGLTEGATVTATVTPTEGYLLVPGSLRYATPDGFVKRILNKDGDFGTGDGNTFTFTKPLDNIRVLADFVKTDATNFAWGTVGTSVHVDENDENDGIRFLTRVNMTAFDETASGLSLKYGGETYTVKKIGLLLKRSANANELTLDNWSAYGAANGSEKIWGVNVYDSTTNNYLLTDYTDTYIDYTIAMVTSNPSEAFNERVYTARGFLVLEKGGVETVLYSDERTDSVNTTLARMNGELSDNTIVAPDTDSGSGDDGDDPTGDESSVPADDKDYTNADLKILSIGNSYSQDAQAYLAKMATAEGKTFKCVNLYKSGCALSTHANGWTNTEAIYNYELNGTATADYTKYVSLKAVLESDQFDVITLQQASWTSVNYSTYQPYLNNLIAAIREKQPNAKLYIHQTWSYGDANSNHTSNPTYTGGTMAAMWTKIEAAYNSAATETGLELIPAGQAIQNAQEALNAGGYSETNIQRDNAHVSKTWGRYLLARVWYEALTGDTPTVTLDQLNTSVAANSAMETLMANAAAAALNEYPVEEAA